MFVVNLYNFLIINSKPLVVNGFFIVFLILINSYIASFNSLSSKFLSIKISISFSFFFFTFLLSEIVSDTVTVSVTVVSIGYIYGIDTVSLLLYKSVKKALKSMVLIFFISSNKGLTNFSDLVQLYLYQFLINNSLFSSL
jgi:hypothetical protein